MGKKAIPIEKSSLLDHVDDISEYTMQQLESDLSSDQHDPKYWFETFKRLSAAYFPNWKLKGNTVNTDASQASTSTRQTKAGPDLSKYTEESVRKLMELKTLFSFKRLWKKEPELRIPSDPLLDCINKLQPDKVLFLLEYYTFPEDKEFRVGSSILGAKVNYLLWILYLSTQKKSRGKIEENTSAWVEVAKMMLQLGFKPGLTYMLRMDTLVGVEEIKTEITSKDKPNSQLFKIISSAVENSDNTQPREGQDRVDNASQHLLSS